MSEAEEPGQEPEIYGDGITFVQWWLLWLLGGVVAIVSVALDILVRRTDSLPGRDFTNLWTAGKLVWAHTPQCAFDTTCFQIAMIQNLHIATVQNYSYPPSALLIAAPFALLPYYAALALWTIAGVAFFAWAARPYLPKGFPIYLAVLTPAATINIWNGHYGFLLGALWLLFFRELERRRRVSGIAAGLLTFKPHLGLMIALTALRKRQVLLAAIASFACLIILSSLLFGFSSWSAFFRSTTSVQSGILTSSYPLFYFKMMTSPYVAFGRGQLGTVAQVIATLSALALLLRYRQWDAFSAATATFLLIPYSFNYDMTVADLGFAIFLFERWSHLGRAQKAVFLIAFFSPELVYWAAPLVPVALLMALGLQLEFASNPDAPTRLIDSVREAFRRPPVGSQHVEQTQVA